MPEGFFSLNETQGSIKKDNCLRCKLARTCVTPKMEASGLGNKKYLIVTGAPKKTDDEKGIQLVDEQGRFIRQKFQRLGINLKQDFRKTNAICCRPPEGRPPTPTEIENCRPRLFQEVEKNPPTAVFLFGKEAIESWWENRLTKNVGNIDKWRGVRIPDLDHKCWVFHFHELGYILKAAHFQPVIETVLENDLKRALAEAKEPFYHVNDYENRITILNDRREIVRWLKVVPAGSLFTFDFEATGLKPYNDGHKIICVGCSLDGLSAVSFVLDDKRVRKEFCKTLERPDLYLCAQHIQFEDMWAKVRLGVSPRNWAWDPMLACHVLDNRKSITGLKWQAFQRFGVIGYDSEVAPWMASHDGGNGFNQLKKRMESPKSRKKILTYCGMDALLEARIALEQMSEFGTFPWDL